MGLTRDYNESFSVLEILVEIKNDIDVLKDNNLLATLQDSYKQSKDKSDEVAQKIYEYTGLVAQNKKQLGDIKTSNDDLDAKKASLDALSNDLDKKKNQLDQREKDLDTQSDSQNKKQKELDDLSADISKKMISYNQNIEILKADQKDIADTKELLRQRANKIKAVTEGL